MEPTTRRRTLVAVAVAGALTAAACGVALVVGLTREPERVETQGTMTPEPRRPPGTAGTTVPPTTTTTTAPPTTTTTAPPPPTTRVVRPAPAPAPPAPPPTEAPAPPPADPFRVRIDRIGVDAPIVPVGVEPGTNAMEIPALDTVGWYQYGAAPGDPAGTAVLVGHVDGNGLPGVFADLRSLAPGDTFTVTLPSGATRTFAVTGLQQYDKQALPADFFARGGAPRLALITCGGPFDPATGHYLDNVVVVATAI